MDMHRMKKALARTSTDAIKEAAKTAQTSEAREYARELLAEREAENKENK
jgi:hypothetical protein